jgi:hypothetical protein
LTSDSSAAEHDDVGNEKEKDTAEEALAESKKEGEVSKVPTLSETKSNTTRTVLLTVPLFLKFVVVLIIKFLTDLIVFPALFLYRIAHNAKRKVLNLFGNSSTKPNGETS